MRFRPPCVALLAVCLLLAGGGAVLSSTMHDYEATCGNCGLTSTQRFINFTAPLPFATDFRPRATVVRRHALNICPGCGYLSYDDFAKPLSPAVRSMFESPGFAALGKDASLPKDVSVFLRSAMLNEAAAHWFEAGNDLLDAAWLFDPGGGERRVGSSQRVRARGRPKAASALAEGYGRMAGGQKAQPGPARRYRTQSA